MAFVKILRTKSYYSRFQVPLRRRREGKTDYQARRNLIRQDKNKYNAPKYRLVVRFTNSKVICQIVWATISGDRILCAAESTELARYGMPVGLTNYAAAYATGLLVARRTLKKLGLDKILIGKEEADGQEYHIEEEETERRPFKCLLDIGLVRTTTGNRVFAAMKGAVDGGIHVPHSTKRFPGYKAGTEGADDSYDPEVHRQRIFACHVANYMKLMKDEEPDRYPKYFSRYLAAGIDETNLEEKIKAVHMAIRANPDRAKKEEPKQVRTFVREGDYIRTQGKDGQEVKFYRPKRLTREQRKAKVQAKIAALAERAAAAMAED